LLLHSSLDGSSFVILSEELPFPISIDQYITTAKNHLGILMSNAVPISIVNYNGVKYDILLPNGTTQAQIAFIKYSQAFIIEYTVSHNHQRYFQYQFHLKIQ